MRTSSCALAALLFSVSAPAVATNLPALQSTIKYSTTSTAASGFGNFAQATSTVVYDPATDTYTVRDTGSLTTKSSFGPANIDAGASDAAFTVYSKNSGKETFRLLNQSALNPLIVLSYVDYGQWRRTSTANGVTSVNDTYLVFGQKTPKGSVPTSGTGYYNTVVDGTFINKIQNYAVGGSGTFTASFFNGTISYSNSATGVGERDGATIDFGTMTGSGSIARSGSFKGTGSADTQGYSMDVAGSFYGPSAQEVGGLFHMRGNGGTGEGALVGKYVPPPPPP
jgi:hypothetical protein